MIQKIQSKCSMQGFILIVSLFLGLVNAEEKVIQTSQLPQFEDITAKSGIHGSDRAAWADYNNDRFPDLYTSGRLFKNNKDRTFSDVTTEVKLNDSVPTAGGKIALWADFDNDGWVDLYIADGDGKLYLNQKGEFFTAGEVSKNPHQKAMAAAAADFDGDGWVDLYVANFEDWIPPSKPFPDLLFQNKQGRLELWAETDIENTFAGRGVTCADFNEDGKIDIFVSNYRLAPNFLWVNQGDWFFKELGRALGAAGKPKCLRDPRGRHITLNYANKMQPDIYGHTVGSVWADLNNDLYFDLIVGNFSHPPGFQDRIEILKNLGPAQEYRFENQSGYTGTDKDSNTGLIWKESYVSPAAADFDNDGLLDFFISTFYEKDESVLYRNEGSFKFSDVTKQTKVHSKETYQAAWADFDNDGFMDLITGGHLFRNLGNKNSWVKICLRSKKANTMAVGTRVVVELPTGEKFLRQVETSTGSGNQNDSTLHFGLGTFSGKSVGVTIFWPSGAVARGQIPLNNFVEVTENE